MADQAVDNSKALVVAHPSLTLWCHRSLSLLCRQSTQLQHLNAMIKHTTCKNHLILLPQGVCCKELPIGSKSPFPRVLHFSNLGRTIDSCRSIPKRMGSSSVLSTPPFVRLSKALGLTQQGVLRRATRTSAEAQEEEEEDYISISFGESTQVASSYLAHL